MPRCACASEVCGSVSVCVDCYGAQLRINEVQVRVSIVIFSIRGFAK